MDARARLEQEDGLLLWPLQLQQIGLVVGVVHLDYTHTGQPAVVGGGEECLTVYRGHAVNRVAAGSIEFECTSCMLSRIGTGQYETELILTG